MCTHTQGGHASQGGGRNSYSMDSRQIRAKHSSTVSRFKIHPQKIYPNPSVTVQWLVYISKHKLNAVKYQVLHTLVNLTTFIIYIEKYQICSNPIFKLIILPEPKLKTSVADPE